MIKLTLDLFIELSNSDNTNITLESIKKLVGTENENVVPKVHVLAKINKQQDILSIYQSLDFQGVKTNVIGYIEPCHQSLSKNCSMKYIAFMKDGIEYDVNFFNRLNKVVYIERKPILLARNDSVSCTTTFLYKQFSLDENPLQNIYESLVYSKPHTVIDEGNIVEASTC